MYYKIVRSEAGKLVSFVQRDYIGRVEYKQGETVFPKDGNGPLAVFDSLQSAKNFLLHEALCGSFLMNVIIFSCEIEESRCHSLFTRDSVIRVTKKSFLPSGTVLADSVKLVERVFGAKIASRNI